MSKEDNTPEPEAAPKIPKPPSNPLKLGKPPASEAPKLTPAPPKLGAPKSPLGDPSKLSAPQAKTQMKPAVPSAPKAPQAKTQMKPAVPGAPKAPLGNPLKPSAPAKTQMKPAVPSAPSTSDEQQATAASQETPKTASSYKESAFLLIFDASLAAASIAAAVIAFTNLNA